MAQSIFIPIGTDRRLSALWQGGPEAETAGEEETLPPPDKPLVVMMHGFPGHKASRNDIFGELEGPLAQDGFHTLRFDFRGCGESEGRAEDFTLASAREDVVCVLSWAQSFGYERFFFIGEGLGGLVALESVTKQVRGAVLLWPALDPRFTSMREALEAAEAETFAEKNYVLWKGVKAGRALLAEIRSFNAMRRLRRLDVPLLIQHGEKDEEVPVSQIEMLRRHARNRRRIEVTTYEQGTHGLPGLNERQTMHYHIRQFLKRYA